MSALVAAELLKIRTTRTPWGLLAATVVISALAVASAVIVASEVDFDPESQDVMRTILASSSNGGLIVLMLGVIISAGEFRHGTAVETFLTTPARGRIVVAKLGVATTVGIIFGALAATASLAAAAITYRAEGYALPLESTDAWLTLGGAAIYAALMAVLGAAAGSMIRNQVAAMVGWLLWFAVVEHIAGGFAPSLAKWLPFGAGRALAGSSGDDLLAPPVAGLVLVLYTTAFAVAAIVAERRRDV